ncbi:hypothetical protein XM38_011610 [Halomicronema hongdechloris C2206]|uniref:SGNH hydrolase-type esterase domain-containing protein n=1 Tax=Halomicronema hongdechloris C2206 TaxID=1641165 RepID=A0A1Z3HIZ1_9CYAN|nr:SGNH/GDSL hydrolase family protein [Halomicronema hongdechloris]ASC70226.1 hypothetical protein XM38_011610 [Halomicronema hongdechloris C2206]
MKLLLITLVVISLGVAVLEGLLRWIWGLGNPPLYVADAQVGYRLAPNQRLRRFGNEIEINQYSMRGPAITAERPADMLRLLLLGDSIANGGWWTDQQEIVSMLIQRHLASRLTHYRDVQVLNASANSWGPRNELAYLARFGSFQAQGIVLLINTDDLFAIAPTSVPVGCDRTYPNRKPLLALAEVIARLRPPTPLPAMEALHQESGDRVGANLEAIRQIQHVAAAANAYLIVAMTPLKRELGDPGPRNYELKARHRLRKHLDQQQIPYLDFLTPFNQAEAPMALYRDHIHLSPQGNQVVSQAISQTIIERELSPQSQPGSSLAEDVWSDPWL